MLKKSTKPVVVLKVLKSLQLGKTEYIELNVLLLFFFFFSEIGDINWVSTKIWGTTLISTLVMKNRERGWPLKTLKTEKSLKLTGLVIKGFSYWRNCSIVSVGKPSIEIFSIKQESKYNRFLILFAVEILHMTTCFIPRFQFSCPLLRMWTEKNKPSVYGTVDENALESARKIDAIKKGKKYKVSHPKNDRGK